jgi:hypothetical protein
VASVVITAIKPIIGYACHFVTASLELWVVIGRVLSFRTDLPSLNGMRCFKVFALLSNVKSIAAKSRLTLWQP